MQKSGDDKVNMEDNYKSGCPILRAEVPQNLPNWTEINILLKSVYRCPQMAEFLLKISLQEGALHNTS